MQWNACRTSAVRSPGLLPHRTARRRRARAFEGRALNKPISRTEVQAVTARIHPRNVQGPRGWLLVVGLLATIISRAPTTAVLPMSGRCGGWLG
jgi:hypothetical protein